MSAIIRVRGLKKAFGASVVLRDVDLDFPEGAITSVVGQSGTGKSVLFKTMIGL
ncbi:MAG: ATP-binding cassette domain-containing protein, partial [Treponemataceae bacterium]